jgi:hypothetical protein
MKLTSLGLVFTLALAAKLPAADPAMASPQSAYDQAVKSYVDAATDQIHAIRNQVDAEVGPTPVDAVKQRFAKAYSQLDDCEQLLAKLKSAGPPDFDKIKAQFEQKRAEMLKSLDSARKS